MNLYVSISSLITFFAADDYRKWTDDRYGDATQNVDELRDRFARLKSGLGDRSKGTPRVQIVHGAAEGLDIVLRIHLAMQTCDNEAGKLHCTALEDLRQRQRWF